MSIQLRLSFDFSDHPTPYAAGVLLHFIMDSMFCVKDEDAALFDAKPASVTDSWNDDGDYVMYWRNGVRRVHLAAPAHPEGTPLHLYRREPTSSELISNPTPQQFYDAMLWLVQ